MTLDDLTAAGFDVHTRNHARAILTRDFPAELSELCEALSVVRIPIEELIRGGGGEAPVTQRLRHSLDTLAWRKRNVEIRKYVDDEKKESVTHEIDHFRKTDRGSIALEIEWNNKDPFFDRDLETFQRLHAEGVISVGVIVTRGSSLQSGMLELVRDYATARQLKDFGDLASLDINPTPRQRTTVDLRIPHRGDFAEVWPNVFVQDKFGAATTHWEKLELRIQRGTGNPCPLLLIGIPNDVVVPQEMGSP